MASNEEVDVFFDAVESADNNEIFLGEVLEEAPTTWDYELREGFLIPEANLIQQVECLFLVFLKQ